MSQICHSCGHENPDDEFLCRECDADLTAFRPPQPTQVQDPPPDAEDATAEAPEECSPTLELVVGSKTFPCRDGAVLGREGNLAKHLFQDIDTVSRRHLFLCLEDGVWRVRAGKNVSNSTTLDGDEMDRDKPYPLDEGEYELTMSRACKFTLRVKMPEESKKQ